MKTFTKIIVFTFLISVFPSYAKADIEIVGQSETRTGVQFENMMENKINLRRLDLNKKLFKEEVADKREEFKNSREDFKNSSPETRNMLRADFRAKFTERFKFTSDKLMDFQTRVQTKINSEKSAGVNVEQAQIKLDQSISLNTEISADIESLKNLLEERYSEDERSAKKEKARILVENIKKNIKASHGFLKESMKELRLAISTKAEINLETSVDIQLQNN